MERSRSSFISSDAASASSLSSEVSDSRLSSSVLSEPEPLPVFFVVAMVSPFRRGFIQVWVGVRRGGCCAPSNSCPTRPLPGVKRPRPGRAPHTNCPWGGERSPLTTPGQTSRCKRETHRRLLAHSHIRAASCIEPRVGCLATSTRGSVV